MSLPQSPNGFAGRCFLVFMPQKRHKRFNLHTETTEIIVRFRGSIQASNPAEPPSTQARRTSRQTALSGTAWCPCLASPGKGAHRRTRGATRVSLRYITLFSLGAAHLEGACFTPPFVLPLPLQSYLLAPFTTASSNFSRSSGANVCSYRASSIA